MANQRYDYAAVAVALKRALKKKKVSYRELGEKLGLSESGIKKVMTGEDVSLSRLGAICAAVEIDFVDLLQVAWNPEPAPITFTAEQEAFLTEHRDHHRLLAALINCKFDVERLMREFDLDRASVDRYASKLEDHGFVDVLPGGRIKPTFGEGGWFRYKSGEDGNTRVLDALRAALDNPREDRCLRNGRVRITEKHFDELNADILDLLLKWQRIATQDEMYVEDAELLSVWVLAGTAKQKMSDVVKIPRLS